MWRAKHRCAIRFKKPLKRIIKTGALFFGLLFLLFNIFASTGAFSAQEDLYITATVAPSGPAPPPAPPGGGGGAPVLAPATVVLKGRAYPKASITILKNGRVAATFKALSSGFFEKELTGVNAGIYTFGVFAEDTEGRKSVTVSFTVGVLSDRTTTISGIFLSPTISLQPTQVERGNIVNFSGQIFPESEVKIFISSKSVVKKTSAESDGKWNYSLNTAPLEEEEHEARAKGILEEGEQSPFSQTLSFLIVPRGGLVCQGADLNFDGKINIVDFSILLYFWKQSRPANRCADINFDGMVDIIDFSIMMYQWNP